MSEVRGKEGISLGMYSAHALQASRMRVAYASQLYNYILRFYLIGYIPIKLATNLYFSLTRYLYSIYME